MNIEYKYGLNRAIVPSVRFIDEPQLEVESLDLGVSRADEKSSKKFVIGVALRTVMR